MKRYFTLDEANNLLPQIKEAIESVQDIQYEFAKKYHAMNDYKKRYVQGEKPQDYEEYVFLEEAGLEFMEIQTRAHLSAIHETGVLVKEINPGLVDFPSLMDHKEVLLCWKQGEPQISHYHGVDDGFAGRKKLDIRNLG
ncbi:DUF2203 domain-containing protein [Aneurinibacillus sp. Ricciae_BoGa-3]|uniref:DUF2203 domain-containing protein n=1 Tax=Aneurinibacillus sp. Ricciae_BoGa-3 TaxID=3022697 RepID=UPI002340FA0A|nr:DUF2203 domain-containing protein [Aneurinibacillus sp. Ricciae_BoGa-3]WCK56560.1 DUF2203 domain-containing protein [Aneurinibacillus sp. Ricciae_BoGa-3]